MEVYAISTSSSDEASFFSSLGRLSAAFLFTLTTIYSLVAEEPERCGVGAKRTWLESCHQALSELETCERTPAVVRFMSSYIIYLPVAFCWEQWLKAAVVAGF